VCRWSSGFEGSTVPSGRSSKYAVRKGKFDIGIKELLGCWTDDSFGRNSFNFHNLNTVTSATVTSSHVHVHLVDSSTTGNITELLCNIVLIRGGHVTESNLEVLHLLWLLFVNPVDGKDFAIRSLNPLERSHVVPETGFCRDNVRSKNDHTANLGLRISRGGFLSSYNLILDDQDLPYDRFCTKRYLCKNSFLVLHAISQEG